MSGTPLGSGGATQNEGVFARPNRRAFNAAGSSISAMPNAIAQPPVGSTRLAATGLVIARVRGASSRSSLTARGTGRSAAPFAVPTTSATPSGDGPVRRMPSGRAASSLMPLATSVNGSMAAVTTFSIVSSWSAYWVAALSRARTSTTRTASVTTTGRRTLSSGVSSNRPVSGQPSRSTARRAHVVSEAPRA